MSIKKNRQQKTKRGFARARLKNLCSSTLFFISPANGMQAMLMLVIARNENTMLAKKIMYKINRTVLKKLVLFFSGISRFPFYQTGPDINCQRYDIGKGKG